MTRTDRFATVSDASSPFEYRILPSDVPPCISGTYDERTGTVVLGRLPEGPSLQPHGHTICTQLPEKDQP